MAPLSSTRSSYSPPDADKRRDYSTPLPFEYAKQSSKAPHLKSRSIGDDESQCRYGQGNAELTESCGPIQPESLLPRDQPCVSQEDLEIEDNNQMTCVTISPPKTTPQPGPFSDHRNKAPTLNFSRPSPRKFDPILSGSTQKSLGLVVRDGVMHQMERRKGIAYEHVDGVSMDTQPASSTSAYDSNEPIPEIEARDINEIPRQPEHTYPVYDHTAENQQSPTQSRESSNSDGDMYRSGYWSGTSNSTPTTSMSGNSTVHNDDAAAIPLFGGQHYDHRDVVHLPTETVVFRNEAVVPYAHVEYIGPASPGLGKKLELGVIKEEDGEVALYDHDLSAAPSPTVSGVKDTSSGAYEHCSPSRAEAAKQDGVERPTGEPTWTGGNQPPRVLVAPGNGDHRSIHELEATSLTRANSDQSSLLRNGTIDGSPIDTASSESSGRTGLLGEIYQGVATAAHAVEAKVKKSVTFSPVEDVRFLTPSPNRLGENTRHEANKVQRSSMR